MSRIKGTIVPIVDAEILKFFEGRARKYLPSQPLTSVMYQDRQPDLAVRRDAHERSVVLPMLKPTDSSRVLDVGCGIGRWASHLNGMISCYHGVDFSPSLIEIARSRVTAPRFTFEVCCAQNLSPQNIPDFMPFDLAIVAGVLMYLNDAEVAEALTRIGECMAGSSTIYLREPVAFNERLTLQSIESTELGGEYSAIYRTKDELKNLFATNLAHSGFSLKIEAPMYSDSLNNRKDTAQMFFLLERNEKSLRV